MMVGQVDDNDCQLNDTWSVYFHDPADQDWSCSSYKLLCTLSRVQDYAALNAIIGPTFGHAMYFVMREHVFPCWDDPYNLQGGCISLKIPKEHVQTFWDNLCMAMLGESITHDPVMWDAVHGVSISPKRYFCILKIWFRTQDIQTKDQINIDWASYGGDILFKSNLDNIRTNNESLAKKPQGQGTTAPAAAHD